MKTNFKSLLLVLFFGLIFLNSCKKDEETIVLQGVDFNGEVSNLKISGNQSEALGATTATIKTVVNALDDKFKITEHGHVWSASNTLPTVEKNDGMTKLGALTSPGTITSKITDLKSNTNYYVRTYFKTDKGVGYGSQVSIFKTGDALADVIVINEGNFNSGDGSITTFSSQDKTVKQVAYAIKNAFPIGAIIQNTLLHENAIYAVCNKTDKVEIFNAETFAQIKTIKAGFAKNLDNPFDVAVTADKIYVSNWGEYNSSTYTFKNPFVAVFKKSDYSFIKKIDLDGKPQHLLAYGKKVFVAENGSNAISIIDTDTDELVASKISVANKPDNMLLDKNNKLWVLCNSGNLVRIDPESNTVETTISDVKVQGFNAKFISNATKDKFYFLNSKGNATEEVYEFDIASDTAPTTAIITGKNFHGIGVSKDNIFYAGDHKAYKKNGEVIRYKLDGTEIDRFDSGKAPNGFIFR